MGMHRSELKRGRRLRAAKTKTRKRFVKDKERVRRDARMTEMVRNGQLPYAPAVMSWLSRKLDKKASRITFEDVNPLSFDAAASGSARN